MRSQITRRRQFVLAVSTVLCGSLAGCAGNGGEDNGGTGEQSGSDGLADSADVDADHTVLVGPDGDDRFEPRELEIDIGDTVEFVWEDTPHTLIPVVEPDESDWEAVQESPDEGQAVTHTFDLEGVHWYYCAIHGDRDVSGDSVHLGGMEGLIVVGDADPDEVIDDEDEVSTPSAAFTINDADPDTNEILLHHAGGNEILAGELLITITVDGSEVFEGLLHEATDQIGADEAMGFGDTIRIPLDADFSEGADIVVSLVYEPTGELLDESSFRRW